MDLPKTDNPVPLPEPFVDLHTVYTAEQNREIDNGTGKWKSSNVIVKKNGEQIYEFVRHYSFSREFEPFRQLQGDRWHDYALISSAYTTFQVLDLESGEVVATRPYPTKVIPDEWFTEMPQAFEPGKWLEGKKPGDSYQQEGFCPVEFYVPDPFEDYYGGDEGGPEEYRYYEYFNEEVREASGQFGFYSGCIWGDDSSWKLRGIDLSRIAEGVVTDDERFGYWELPAGRLKDNVNWEYKIISAWIHVNMQTGKASHYTRDGINWTEPKKKEEA